MYHYIREAKSYCPNMYTVIIGHAVNDSISTGGGSNSTEETPPGDFLANRMICFMAQGLSQDFHHVRYFLEWFSVITTLAMIQTKYHI